VSRKFSHWEKEFQCVSLDSHSSLDLDAKGHQLSFSDFDLNSCSHRVKIEVKQVNDNYTSLYNENQYLNVELSYFVNRRLINKYRCPPSLVYTFHYKQGYGNILSKTLVFRPMLLPISCICGASLVRKG